MGYDRFWFRECDVTKYVLYPVSTDFALLSKNTLIFYELAIHQAK